MELVANGTCSSQTEIPSRDFPNLFVNGKLPITANKFDAVVTLLSEEKYKNAK